jgi:membrane protein involved in colicin uptake
VLTNAVSHVAGRYLGQLSIIKKIGITQGIKEEHMPRSVLKETRTCINSEAAKMLTIMRKEKVAEVAKGAAEESEKSLKKEIETQAQAPDPKGLVRGENNLVSINLLLQKGAETVAKEQAAKEAEEKAAAEKKSKEKAEKKAAKTG